MSGPIRALEIQQGTSQTRPSWILLSRVVTSSKPGRKKKLTSDSDKCCDYNKTKVMRLDEAGQFEAQKEDPGGLDKVREGEMCCVGEDRSQRAI